MANDKKSLTDLAKANPSQIGDPVSLKAETSHTEPTENDKPANGDKDGGEKEKDKKSLKELAEDKLKSNPSALGDPISLKAETADSQPTDEDMPNKAGSARGSKL